MSPPLSFYLPSVQNLLQGIQVERTAANHAEGDTSPLITQCDNHPGLRNYEIAGGFDDQKVPVASLPAASVGALPASLSAPETGGRATRPSVLQKEVIALLRAVQTQVGAEGGKVSVMDGTPR